LVLHCFSQVAKLKKNPWTTEEDDRLRSLARSGYSLTEIAHRMGRNESSIRTRAIRIELSIARDRNAMQVPPDHASRFVEIGLKVKGTKS
jgi:hypothetical protein